MSRAHVTRPTPGVTLRSRVQLQEAFDALVSVSDDVEEENLADEGFDHRAVAAGVLSSKVGHFQSNNEFSFSSAAWAKVVDGANNVEATNIVVPANHILLVQVGLDVVNLSIPAGDFIEFDIAYQISGGGPTQANVSVHKGDPAVPTGGSFSLATLLAGGVTYDWIALYGRVTGGGTLTIGYPCLTVEQFKGTF